MKSLQPSPMPPDSRAFRQLELAGPPVSRLETEKRGESCVNKTSKVIRTTVSILVDHDSSLKGAVAVRRRLGPDVHAHAAGLAIRRSGKVGVVGARAVLGVQDDIVISQAALPVSVVLEVTGLFGEAQGVKQIMVDIGSVEELDDRCVDVG